MIPALSALVVVASAVITVQAQGDPGDPGFVPLAERRFDYNALPYQVDPNDGDRGRQYGYNICNATTENQESLCQTAIINGIDDFCLWGPPEPDSLIGDTEGEAVAWCTKAGHGTRIFPEGTITGLQFIRTPDYIQVTGTINQANMNIEANDSGGEMDPHGADQRGNPLGGLLFSTAFGTGYRQVIEWHNFMGGGLFCLKACNPDSPDGPRYCEHIFDRIGCWYNAPAPYEEGVFEACEGENQDFPGTYTGEDGQLTTYTQPPESEGPIATMPYQPRRPASSECQPYESAALFTDAVQGTIAPTSARPSSSRSSSSTRSGSRTSTSTNTADSSEEGEGSGAASMKITTGFVGAVLAAVAVGFAL